jgi:Tfp pilus assembly protein FimT
MRHSRKEKRSKPHTRSRYVATLGMLVMAIAALVAVLALPAIERVIWRDIEQASNH